MKYAALDIGSQSILLLIADVSGDGVVPLREEAFAPRLGQGLTSHGRLLEESMARAEADLVRAVEICGEHGIGKGEIVAAATAAVREAANGREFVSRISDRLGVDIRVLSGTEEAELSYTGAVSGMELNGDELVAVLDVGGGSSECVVGCGSRVTGAISVPVGAVSLAERYGRSPGAKPEAVEDLRRHFGEAAAAAGGSLLLGIGGSATTLAAVRLGLRTYDPDAISRCVLATEECVRLINLFRGMEVGEIQKLPGMEPSRADIIEAGATIIKTFMSLAGSGEIRISPRGLRYGLLACRGERM